MERGIDMKKLKIMLSITIVLTLVFSTFSFSASAIEPTTLAREDVPSILDYKEVKSQGAVRRLRENEENLSSIVFENSDGTNSLYVFTQNVKYADTDGTIRDIDNSIVHSSVSGYKYQNSKNDLLTLFPNKFDGSSMIKLSYNGYDISFAPEINLDVQSQYKKSQNAVVYPNAFGDGISLSYTSNYSGIKEEIIIDSKPQNNTFSFLLELHGLVPVLGPESIALYDDKGQIISVIGQVDIKDSSNSNGGYNFSLNNSLDIETLYDNKYRVTVAIDQEFLESSNTVYPVVVDPNISINKTHQKDTTVYTNKPTGNFWSSAYNNVGDHGTSYGIGTGFVQFDFSAYKEIPFDGITSAIYRVYEGSGKTNSSTIDIRQPSGVWTDTSLTYNNRPGISSTNIASQTITTSKYYEFNITSLVKSYIQYEKTSGAKGANPKRGMALVARSSSASSKHFCSAQHGNYPPVLKITYTNYALLGPKWSSRNCKFKISELPTAYQNGVRDAINSWNAVNINFSFTVDNNSSNRIYCKSSGMTQGTVAYCSYSWYTSNMNFASAEIVFNTQHHTFSYNVTSGNFHIASIARHELGHALGLGDIYIDSNAYAVMYGYSSPGESVSIKSADIIGAQKIYGSRS